MIQTQPSRVGVKKKREVIERKKHNYVCSWINSLLDRTYPENPNVV